PTRGSSGSTRQFRSDPTASRMSRSILFSITCAAIRDTAVYSTESASTMAGRLRSTAHITQLLIAWSDGQREAIEDLLPLVYGELRRLASRYVSREPVGHKLQPTELVHEAYMRLIDQRKVQWRNRAHFYGIAAQIMRRILVDHARARTARKRGVGWQ